MKTPRQGGKGRAAVTLSEALAALERLERAVGTVHLTQADIRASQQAQNVVNRYIRAHADAVALERENIAMAQELELTRQVLLAVDEREKAGHREATVG
jgi:hypothetical protein